MKESVLSLKDKTTQHWCYLNILSNGLQVLIIFYDWLVNYYWCW